MVESRSELRRVLRSMKKKDVINLCGYKNIKEYYRASGDAGKVSKKQFVKLYMLNA